jgi:nitrite reductase/ring-hydroxylating ferredoxin subunit
MSSTETPAQRHLLDRIREDRLVTRRDYLRILVTVSGGLLAGTGAVASGIFRRLSPGAARPKRIADEVAPGDAVHFSYPGDDDPAIAVRLAGGRLVAFSAVCTHLSCAVLWIKESGKLECPCHDGVFEPRDGSVVAGPPPRPLTRIRVEERADGIYATRVET